MKERDILTKAIKETSRIAAIKLFIEVKKALLEFDLSVYLPVWQLAQNKSLSITGCILQSPDRSLQ